MKIKTIVSQNRRDFYADYECEHCGHIDESKSGYDDTYFHQFVIPDMICPKCLRKASGEYRALSTKYPDHLTV